MDKKIKIQFLGAAGTVTGSKHLLTINSTKILIDCGLFQGIKQVRQLNWETLPVNPADIDIILLTHGHMDHTGYLPRLVNEGFKGRIIGTAPTLEIATIILKDSAKIQEEEAEKANNEGYSKHHPAAALYTLKDVDKTLPLFEAVNEGEWMLLIDNINVRFQYNGHILGATFIEMEIENKRLVFSGDVGRDNDMLMYNPKRPDAADVLLIESTYGDRLHPKEDVQKKLQKIITDTIAKGGTLIIPSFAVERNQLIMYILWQLREKKLIPDIPVYMDSPMGANVLQVFHNYPQWHKLKAGEYSRMFDYINVIRSYKETLSIAENKAPKIIIAGSGMVTGGRVLTYLQDYLQNPATTILLVGYQAEGTRGRKLLEGTHELKIYGKYYDVKANVESIQSLSAHADQQELIHWLKDIKNKPEKVFIVHGEAQAADTFRNKLKDTYGWDSVIPSLYDEIEIDL